MPVLPRLRVRFGPFELDVQSGELFKLGHRLKLQGQPIQLLAILLERPGMLVTREELRERLWPAESATFVDFEHGLNTAIKRLRAALGDEAETPRYIETLPRRGYRFIGEIGTEDRAVVSANPNVATPDAAASGSLSAKLRSGVTRDIANIISSMTSAIQEQKRRTRRWIAVLGLLLAVLVGAVLMLDRNFSNPGAPRIVATKRLTFNEHVGAGAMATLEAYDSIQSDGRRVYYTVSDEQHLRYVPVNGGGETTLFSSLVFPVVLHLSPDASTLLIKPRGDPNGTTESDIWAISVDGRTVRKVGDIRAQDAAFAPDGKTIVFAQDQELYRTNLQGDSPAKLASLAGRAFWLRWSPDGTKLRFTLVDPKRLTYTIWELRSDGSPERLLSGWHKGTQVCCGVWTADGEYFLFRELKGGGEAIWSLPEKGVHGLAASPSLLSTGGLNMGGIAASPLEKKLFASIAAPLFEVLIRNANRGDLHPLEIGLPLERAVFSRDGRVVVGISQDGEGEALWRVRVEDHDKQQLTAPPLAVFMASISFDNQRIAFMGRQPDQPWRIYWISASGGAMHEVPSPVLNQADPNWSRDGQSILFGQPPLYMGESNAERNLYLYDLRSGTTTKLPNSTGLFSPRWSSDGRYVAAFTIDQQSLIVLDLKNGQRRRLDFGDTIAHPFWSSNNQWVYFNSGPQGGLFRYRVSDGYLQSVPVDVDPRRCSRWMANSMRSDGSLLFTCIQTHRDIYALDWK